MNSGYVIEIILWRLFYGDYTMGPMLWTMLWAYVLGYVMGKLNNQNSIHHYITNMSY